MRGILLLTGSNLRREKGQTAILAALILIASFVLNLWLMLATDYRQNFERQFDAAHAEDVLLQISLPIGTVRKEVGRILSGMPQVQNYEMTQGLLIPASFSFHEGLVTGDMFVLRADDAFSKTLGRPQITAEDAEITDGLYFPLIFASQDIRLGQKSWVEAGGEEMCFPVKGFFNSMLAGSQNCTIVELVAAGAAYEELGQHGVPASLLSVSTSDRESSRGTASRIADALHEAFPDAAITTTAYSVVRQSRYISESITAVILGAAAFFVLAVAVVIASSNTVNHIQQVMPELGVLKALGYTGSQLVAVELVRHTMVSLPTGLLGAGLAVTFYPALSRAMDAQTGIPYTPHFLPGAFAASALICWAAVSVSAWLAARRIRRIEPNVALRTGIPPHSFRPNRASISKSKGPRNLALALQECFASGRRSTLICLTTTVVCLLLVFAVVMVRNVIYDSQPLVNVIGVEDADVMLSTQAADEDILVQQLDSDARVQRIYLYHQEQSVPEPGGNGLTLIVVDDAKNLINQTVLAEGRYPKYANETALGAKHARKRGLEIGDEIEIGGTGAAAKYLITGLTQGTNYLGDEAMLTREGYGRMQPLKNVTYYAVLRDGEDVDAFVQDAKEQLGDTAHAVINIRAVISGTFSVYVQVLRIMVYALVVLSAVLTILVLVLLARTTFAARVREYGVLKALGYTTADLITQTVLSFLIPLSLSAAVSLVGWTLLMNPILSLFLHTLGTVRSTFIMPSGYIAAAGCAFIGMALATVALMASRIRTMSPTVLMGDD